MTLYTGTCLRCGSPFETTKKKTKHCSRRCGLTRDPVDVHPGERWCHTCEKVLPDSEFHKCRTCPGGRALRCRNCNRLAQRRTRLREFGLNEESFEKILESQNGCAICHSPTPRGRNWHLDHDHSCCLKGCPKCFRALLCGKCNPMLGLAEDSIERLEEAILYLRQFVR